jgi:hypothetical protein
MMKIITNTISILYCYWWCSEDDFTFGSLQAHYFGSSRAGKTAANPMVMGLS